MSGQVLDITAKQESTGRAPEGELQPSEFLSHLIDIQNQPSWRSDADKCVDYYDNNQLDQDTLQELRRKGMGPLISNVIAPIVNVVLGMEAKTRSDWRVTGDDDAVTEVAEALSARLFEAERETRADRACSDGYAGQIKAGLGWVEVSPTSNPFQYQYRTDFVHRREIFWDWRDLSYDLARSRYLTRKRWYDLDQAVAYFPKHKEALEAIQGDPHRAYLNVLHRGTDLSDSLESLRALDMTDYEEFRSWDRKRLCLYEMWYRRWVRGYILRIPGNDPVELDMKNPLHIALLSRGMAKPEQAVYSKMRMSIWGGPIKLHDCACKKDYTPYIPFWGYREDRTGVPYGLIRSMLSQQDEVNARRQKMMWLLGAKRVTMDKDALDQETNTIDTMLQEIARPDAVVVLNPSRQNKQGAFNVDHNEGLSKDQFAVMKDAEEGVQRVVGVFNAMLGRESSADSGIAINSLVEQGTTALAEINDNYRFARRMVGERLLDMVRDDLIGQEVTVMVGEQGKRRSISLNQPAVHQPTGTQIVVNDVRSARVKVALEDVPSTPAYRQQQFTMLAELTKGLPPQLQAVVAPFIMEASELQKRREVADALRKALGVVEPRTPEEQQAMAQQQSEQQALQQRAVLLDLGEREARINLINAQADKARTDAGTEGMDEQERAGFEQQVKSVTEEFQRRMDALTAQRLAERSQAQLREQALRNKIASDQQGKEGQKDAVAELKEQMDALVQAVADQLAELGQKAKAKKTKETA